MGENKREAHQERQTGWQRAGRTWCAEKRTMASDCVILCYRS